MTAITPKMVKELREATNAGMGDCKKALMEADGNMDEAVKVLRKRGLAAAAKKSGRAAAEGVIVTVVSEDLSKGYIAEINCETDFVTRSEKFLAFVDDVKALIANETPANLDALLAAKLPSGETVAETTTQLVATLGENLQVRRYNTLGSGDGYVATYVHTGKIGVLVELEGEKISEVKTDEKLQTIGKDVALQAASMYPKYTHPSEIDESAKEAEKAVFAEQFKQQGKPENIIPKIVEGSLQKWFKEVCLAEQEFFKAEPGKKVTVKEYVANAAKEAGLGTVALKSHVRLQLGEGVEKKSDDFAAEVAAQLEASK